MRQFPAYDRDSHTGLRIGSEWQDILFAPIQQK